MLSVCFAHTARSSDWQTMQVGIMQIHFAQQYEKQARYIAGIYHQIMPSVSKKFDHTITELHVIIRDDFDQSNGYSSFFPYNHNGLYLSPATENQLVNNEDWLDALIRHEVVHLYHFDSVKHTWNSAQDIFGRVLLLFPALYLPEWIVEGIATYGETNISLGTGRGSTGYFDAIMRIEKDNGFLTIHEATYNRDGLPNGVSYYYGYYFFEFLQKTYGEDKIYATMRGINTNWPYAYDKNFQNEYFRNIFSLWDEYIIYLDKKFSRQIQSIKTTGLHEGEPITTVSMQLPVPRYDKQGRLHYLYADAYTGSVSLRRKEIHSDNTQTENFNYRNNIKKLSDTSLTTGKYILDFDIHDSQFIVYTKANLCTIQKDWRKGFYFDIHILIPDEEKNTFIDTVIAPCQRYKYVRWHPNGEHIIALRHVAGIAQLHLLDKKGQYIQTLYKGKMHEILGRFDISQDGKNIVIARKLSGKDWNIYIFNFNENKTQKNVWKQITYDYAIDIDPLFEENDNIILFTSNRSGAFNIWKKPYARDNQAQDIPAQSITNVMSAALQPSIGAQGDVVYAKLVKSGFQVMRVPLSVQKATLLASPKPSPAPDKTVIPASSEGYRPYSSFTGLGPRYWVPLINGDDDKFILGAQTGGKDVLDNHVYTVSAAGYSWQHYSPRNKYNYSLTYAFRDLFSVATFQYDSLYLRHDTPTEKKEKNQSAVFLTKQQQSAYVNVWRMRSVDQETTLFGAFSSEMLDYYAVTTSNDEQKFDNIALDSRTQRIGVGLHYTNMSYGRQAIFPVGLQFRLLTERSRKNQQHDNTKNTQVYGWAHLLNTSAHIPFGRGKVGEFSFAAGQTDKSQLFSFGGVSDGTHFSDIGERDFMFPGYVAGESFLKTREFFHTKIRFNIPFSYKSLGFLVPPFGVGKLGIGVFVESLHITKPNFFIDSNKVKKANYQSVGIQATSEFILGYQWKIPLRFIYARGLDENGVYQFGISSGLTSL